MEEKVCGVKIGELGEWVKSIIQAIDKGAKAAGFELTGRMELSVVIDAESSNQFVGNRANFHLKKTEETD